MTTTLTVTPEQLDLIADALLVLQHDAERELYDERQEDEPDTARVEHIEARLMDVDQLFTHVCNHPDFPVNPAASR